MKHSSAIFLVVLSLWPLPLRASSITATTVNATTVNVGEIAEALELTRISDDAAQATSVSFGTAPAAGDLIIVMAHRDGSTTPPTKVTGYTTIDATTGADTNSAILAFKFSDGTETGTGTWTNATSVAALIYRNAGLGGWAKARTAGTTSPMTYGTLTMQNTGGTSWVAGFGATRGSTDVGTNAPTGMTMRASATDIAAFDTGAGVAAWTAQTAAVNGTPAGTISYTLEIMAVPEGELLWTYIQHGFTIGGSATTVAVTMPQTVGPEPHLLLVSTSYSGNPAEVVSIDKGGTLIPIPATSGGDGRNVGASHGYVIGTETATSPITVTYAGPNGGGGPAIWEFAYTGTGTPALDAANRRNIAASGTSPLGLAMTLSGGNDVIVQTIDPANAPSAISSPYNSPAGFYTADSGVAWAAALNQTSGAAPTWTIGGSGESGFAAVAFGLNPTAFVTRAFCDFEAGTDGTTCTSALLHSSLKGWGSGVWGASGSGAAMKFEADASRGLVNSIARLNDGTSAAASAGAMGVQYLTATDLSYIAINYSLMGGSATNSDSFSAGIWFKTDLGDTDLSNFDMFTIYVSGGSGFANGKFKPNPGGTKRALELEVPGDLDDTNISVDANTWYWVTIQYNRTANHVLKVYDGSLNLVGTVSEAHTGTGMPGFVMIGNNSGGTPTTGKYVNFDSLLVDPEGSYPLLP